MQHDENAESNEPYGYVKLEAIMKLLKAAERNTEKTEAKA